MSTHGQSLETGQRHDHADDAHDGPHGTLRDYLVGFVLAVILTAIPFWLVMTRVLSSREATGYIIMAFAVVQIVVHMIYFLHMNAKADDGWSLVALVFTLILVVITLAGSMWVMHHLDINMMPGMMHDSESLQSTHPGHHHAMNDMHDMSGRPVPLATSPAL